MLQNSNSQNSQNVNTTATRSHILSLSRTQKRLLLAAAAVSSICGLAVELLLGTLASYLVGNQALSYGVAVGGFLAAMGIGSYLSRFIATDTKSPLQQRQLLSAFVKVELLIAPLTALLPLGLFALFIIGGSLWLGLGLVTVVLGILAGLEVPLLTRVLELEEGVRDALAGVLALDYLGALLGSLAFPLLLLPLIGLFPAAFVLGALPAFMVFAIGRHFPRLRRWGYVGLAVAVLLCVLAPAAIPISNRLENTLYQAPVITRIQSSYQRIVLTRQGKDLRLFLDGDLQLSTLDEYRYHEALVHPAMSASSGKRRVLVLGAGDGMAVREVLKWSEVERVVLIELDPEVVKLARHHPQLVQVNGDALADSRVEVLNADAFVAVPELNETFDVIIADFPDPDRAILAKLYTEGFYQRLLPRLADGGVFVTQASSPFFAPDVLSCIVATLADVGLSTHPYVVDVPSFGPWGFVLASRQPIQSDTLKLPVPTRYLTEPILRHLFELPKDIQLRDVEVNRLSHPVIVRYQSDPRWATY
ncbi:MULTISPECIES: polyamine aminopropyltransferase [unclassified Coleofasciculus]|uniref:polyamine aminopropyltransferase n=1 Tax=unclassified Coleofasciculus TaxID=2692782 RepID=UPI00188292AC|nr:MULTISPECIES: polyamine aminopropyltransferase [unclassified Coleofasciculus]MBE9126009.1 polyamine aminopropyltransferase [Coleofasciculus sp. LEGE 07081]MBE9149384.1 polyamine aminopropyltransferase [Coleofasciculus sp. LEGE 07092]